MIRNVARFSVRSILKYKMFSLINIAGLATGISASLVIFLIVNYEFSFDDFWKDKSRIYRVVTQTTFPDAVYRQSGAPGPLGQAIRQEIPNIQFCSSAWNGGSRNVSINSNNTIRIFKKQEGIIYVDNFYFDIFSYKWLQGSPMKALQEPFQIVLSESKAKLYFPNTELSEVVGQNIIYDDTIILKVSGVVKDLEKASDFKFKEFVSFSTFLSQGMDESTGWKEWGSANSASQSFIKLNIQNNSIATQRQLDALQLKYSNNANSKTKFILQPISDFHFNSAYDIFDQRQAHKATLYGLVSIAVFLLLLGCFNFINISTAMANQRAKEIGVRRILGSPKWQLMIRFLFETFWLISLASILSLILTPWLLKIFNDFIPTDLEFNLIKNPQIFFFLICVTIIVTFLAGFYPALVLSNFQPVRILKNQTSTNQPKNRSVLLRKMLSIFQFAIAQFFIITTLVVGKQIHYLFNKDLGFKKDAIIYFDVPRDFEHPEIFTNKKNILYQKLSLIPEILQVSLSDGPPAETKNGVSEIEFRVNNKLTKAIVETKLADTTYFDLYNMKLLAGKNLDQSDTLKEYIINENLAHLLGFESPIEALKSRVERGNYGPIQIVGVVADFHSRSLHNPIRPLAFSCQTRLHNCVNISLRNTADGPKNLDRTIVKIEEAWKEIYPETDFKYSFLDESIAKFYKSEMDISKLLTWATGLSIFISCLGLLGLVIFVTEQRMKEISMRKVLGASTNQIVSLLTREFLKLVFFSFVLTVPIAYWANYNWLEDFPFRIKIEWSTFVLSHLLMIILVFLTLSVRVIKIASNKPVEYLK